MTTHNQSSGRVFDECYDTIAEIQDAQDGVKYEVQSLRNRIRLNENATVSMELTPYCPLSYILYPA